MSEFSPILTAMITHLNRTLSSIISPARYAELLIEVFPGALSDIHSMMRHPRSLARAIPTWRPPSLTLPTLAGHDQLKLTLSRHRAGPAARRIVKEAGATREPAYLITARISSPEGFKVSSKLAEGWIRALLNNAGTHSVHELIDEPTPTFCWLVDADFRPVYSPASLFQHAPHAA
ncbi:hypothetical protein H924_05355 [Corynebacterium callunae DSM 20147]|uniref:Uncharacterized protein n=2 Tax=Corynebacterium callunae TaxID=1721 RepID=M1UTK7_9CORY|nr:hypothetical protein H924_05355 [Corynebacterium callunae DSM 20147]